LQINLHEVFPNRLHTIQLPKSINLMAHDIKLPPIAFRHS